LELRIRKILKKIITLTTDFGYKDEYVGLMKGVILGINPNVTIIDLCHKIEAQNVIEAAYLIRSAYSYFPKNTMHVIIVDPGVGSQRKIIFSKTNKHYFLAPDNGILDLIFEDHMPDYIYSVTNTDYFLHPISNTFHGRDIFAPVSSHILNGLNPDNIGENISFEDMVHLKIQRPVMDKNGILQGSIISIDTFGNLTTNIDRKIFKKASFDEKNIQIIIGNEIIKGISNSYNTVLKGKILAIFGSREYLEIAANRGNAQKKLAVKNGHKIKLFKPQ